MLGLISTSEVYLTFNIWAEQDVYVHYCGGIRKRDKSGLVCGQYDLCVEGHITKLSKMYDYNDICFCRLQRGLIPHRVTLIPSKPYSSLHD